MSPPEEMVDLLIQKMQTSHLDESRIMFVGDLYEYEGDAGTSHDMSFPVRLSCAWSKSVSVGFSTVVGTATEGLDYAYTSDSTGITSGSTAVVVPVTTFGDGEDEPHETYFLKLVERFPADVVLQDQSGMGTIRNDDFCPRDPAYWNRHLWLWSVTSLNIGGVEYDQAGIRSLLTYSGTDVASEVAREQAAAKLNLEKGSDPGIQPTADEADQFLAAHPPGSNPAGADQTWGAGLRDDLAVYNTTKCKGPPSERRNGNEGDVLSGPHVVW